MRHVPHPMGDPTGVHPLAFVRVATLRTPMGVKDASSFCSVLSTEAHPLVERALPNGRLEAARTGCVQPNDPLYAEQWALDRIAVEAAWQRTTGDPAVVVAVLDTGLELEHEEFPAETLWANPGEEPDNGIDDDHNGFVDDVVGWDFVFDDNWPEAWATHGTVVSGVLAARTNNGLGIAGLSSSPLMVLSTGGRYDRIVEAMYYAADMGASVINLSAAGGNNDEAAEAAQYLWDNGVTFVAGAGNCASCGAYYPAALPTVIGVSASTEDDELWEDSSHGDWIDVAAPGLDIITTWRDGYATSGGTSLAAPHVAGLAALVYAVESRFTPAEVRGLIRLGADDLGEPGFDELFGYGRINAGQTVAIASDLAACRSDVTFDGTVGMADVLTILGAWGTDDWLPDIDGDATVGFGDLLSVLATWGSCHHEIR